MTTIAFNDFMSGEFKAKEKSKRKKRVKRAVATASTISIPLLLTGSVGAAGLVMTGVKAFASNSAAVPATAAVPVTAKEWMGEQTLSTLAHVLDPVIDILVALSFPIASVVIVGACFLFMFGNAEKAWTAIQNAGLGYVLIQVSPLILDVLKQVGNAV